MLFRDRRDAGEQLAERLAPLLGDPSLIVLGIPRGGVVVAAEIARALVAPLDVFLAQKIGAPGNPEFAIGAISSVGEVWLDDATIAELKIDRAEVARAMEHGQTELGRRAALYRGNRAALDLKDKTVILVDDGIATGATMLAAVRTLHTAHPARLVVAVPVAPRESIAALHPECDEVIALYTPTPFAAVSRFYRDFSQTEDDEVVGLLRTAGQLGSRLS